MYESYGSKKCGGTRVPLIPCGCTATKPLEPDKISNDRFPRCHGCPYPRHGLFCWTDTDTCLRTEMEEINRKSHRRWEAIVI